MGKDIDLKNGIGHRGHPQHGHLGMWQVGGGIPLSPVITELGLGHVLRRKPLSQPLVVALMNEAAAVDRNDKGEARVDSGHGAGDGASALEMKLGEQFPEKSGWRFEAVFFEIWHLKIESSQDAENL